MEPVQTHRRRREFCAELGLGLLLSACDLSGARALPGSGAFRSLGELAAWRPDWRAAAWEPLPAASPMDGPLGGFQRALARLQAGQSRDPVLIVQFGDSHTIAPFFIGRLREQLQARYGAIGPGRLPPG